jgi:serine/threonine-protein kinase
LNDEQKLALLKGLALFKEFSDAELKDLVRAGRWESLRPGAVVIEEGTQGGSLYVILSGDVVVKRAGKDVATLTQGECFGEMGYLGEGKRTASVVATGTVAVMRIDAPLKEWASLPVQLKMTRMFQRILIERLAATTRNLAKYL